MFMTLSTTLLESFYCSMIYFLLYYLFRSFVQLQPFSFGVHPPVDATHLGLVFACIFGVMFIISSVRVALVPETAEDSTICKVHYVPSNRKVI